jgi:hypothetical protein
VSGSLFAVEQNSTEKKISAFAMFFLRSKQILPQQVSAVLSDAGVATTTKVRVSAMLHCVPY